MLHACFYTICLVFRYTLWHFYAFSGTNLLTRCHSASSLFSTVFVFQKCYTRNILGIGRNKSQTSRYFTKLLEDQRGDGEGPHGALTTGWRGLGLAHAPWWWGHPGPPVTPPIDGFRVARTRGTTRRTQRFERRGLNVWDLGSQRNTVTKASSVERATHCRERRRALPRFRALVVR
jgi:hypothetical protein